MFFSKNFGKFPAFSDTGADSDVSDYVVATAIDRRMTVGDVVVDWTTT